MKTLNEIKEYLENLSDSDLLMLWNEYQDENCYDDYIYDMEVFDEIFANAEPSEIARRCYFGDFNPCDDYFVFNGYANLESSNYIKDLISVDDLAQFVYDNDDDLNDDDLRDFLDEEDEDEEGGEE